MLDRLDKHSTDIRRTFVEQGRGIGMSLGSQEVDTTNAVLVDSGGPPSDLGIVVPDPRRWYALGVIAIAQLMVVLDSSIVNLALPSAKADLGISDANQQWVVTAYTLAFGGLLLLGGRVADFVGRKRMFIIGLLGFAGASALGGLASPHPGPVVRRPGAAGRLWCLPGPGRPQPAHR